MDTKSEDTIVRQIEKKLSNDMNENLFLTGRVVENSRIPANNNNIYDRPEIAMNTEENNGEYPLVSNDYISSSQGISRAEYIRQARESCLRQLSNIQIYSKPYDINYMEAEAVISEPQNNKKAKGMKLFHNNVQEEKVHPKENSAQELASYRSLIIRSVLAIVLFLSIFAFDKFDIEVGDLNNYTIQEYVTGNDAFQGLADVLVTWLK